FWEKWSARPPNFCYRRAGAVSERLLDLRGHTGAARKRQCDPINATSRPNSTRIFGRAHHWIVQPHTNLNPHCRATPRLTGPRFLHPTETWLHDRAFTFDFGCQTHRAFARTISPNREHDEQKVGNNKCRNVSLAADAEPVTVQALAEHKVHTVPSH